jgi:flagellar motor switch protein FliN/FliY
MPEENMPQDVQAVDGPGGDPVDKGAPEDRVPAEEEPAGSPPGRGTEESAPSESGDAFDGGRLPDENNSEHVSPEGSPDGDVEKQMLKHLEEMETPDANAAQDGADGEGTAGGTFDAELGALDSDAPEARPADFQQLRAGSEKRVSQNLDLLLDVSLPISIELGRTSMSIQEILKLGPGSIVELDKLAGEPVDLLVNNKIVAKGEVVVIDENFGIRVTSLISPEERLKSLGE